METIKFDVVYTDTFGGQANYCWVERHTITVKENAKNRHIMRLAKACCGLTGVPGRTEDYGDDLTFYPRGMNTVMFVTFQY